MRKGEWKLVIGLVLAVLVIAIIIVNPLSEQQNIPTEAQVNYQFGEPEKVIDTDRVMNGLDVHEDLCVWADFRSSDWDIYGYNISSSTQFSVDTGTSQTMHPEIYDDVVAYNEYTTEGWPNYISVYYLNNFTKVTVANNETRCNDPELWENTLYYSVGDLMSSTYLNRFDLTTYNETNVFTNGEYWIYRDSVEVWGDRLSFVYWNNPAWQYQVVYYNVTTDSGIVVDGSSAIVHASIWGDYIAYKTGGILKLYNIRTSAEIDAVTNMSYTTPDYVYIYKDWVLYVDASGDYEILMAYSISEDESYEVARFEYIRRFDSNYYWKAYSYGMNDDYIMLQAGDDINDQDLYRISITTSEVPTPPSGGEDGSVQEFIQDYWAYLTVGIIGIAGVVAVEGYKYQWEHFIVVKQRVNVGLLASLIIISIIIGAWILMGV